MLPRQAQREEKVKRTVGESGRRSKMQGRCKRKRGRHGESSERKVVWGNVKTGGAMVVGRRGRGQVGGKCV